MATMLTPPIKPTPPTAPTPPQVSSSQPDSNQAQAPANQTNAPASVILKEASGSGKPVQSLAAQPSAADKPGPAPAVIQSGESPNAMQIPAYAAQEESAAKTAVPWKAQPPANKNSVSGPVIFLMVAVLVVIAFVAWRLLKGKSHRTHYFPNTLNSNNQKHGGVFADTKSAPPKPKSKFDIQV